MGEIQRSEIQREMSLKYRGCPRHSLGHPENTFQNTKQVQSPMLKPQTYGTYKSMKANQVQNME